MIIEAVINDPYPLHGDHDGVTAWVVSPCVCD
jgi:hypothetical protein